MAFSESVSRGGKVAVVSIWVAFVVCGVVLMLLTLFFWGFSMLPETWSGDLSDGFYGTLSMELVEPIISSVGFGVVALLLGVLFFVFSISCWFWLRWLYGFFRRRSYFKGSPFLVCLASLVPAFGVLFHGYFLKGALHSFEREFSEQEQPLSPFLFRRFFLWRNSAFVLLWVLGVSHLDYWLSVLFLEFLLLLSIWYYGLLVSTLVKEELKLIRAQSSSSGSGQ